MEEGQQNPKFNSIWFDFQLTNKILIISTTYTYIYDNFRIQFSNIYIEYSQVKLQSHNNTQQSKEFKL